jgi:Baseplate J-like protein
VASPDVSRYVDLTIEDRSPQDLVRSAWLAFQAWLPGVTLAEGHTEAVLIEAFAVQLSELIFAVNRLPSALTEVLLRLYGLERDDGLPPTTTVRFTSVGAYRVESPAGVRLRLDLDGADPLVLTTTEGFVIQPPDSTEAVVAAVGERATAAANGIPAGTPLGVVESLAGIETVALASTIGGGLEPEDGAAFLNRGIDRLARLSIALILPQQFAAAAREDPRWAHSTAVDLYDPGQPGAPGDHPGHVSVAALRTGGDLLPPAEKDELRDRLQTQAQANLIVHVIDPTITPVDVAVTVRGRPGFTDQQITDAVTSAVEAILTPLAWGWETTVYRNDLVIAADTAAGVARVELVLLDGVEADAALPGVAPLADTGTVVVTVNR